MLAPLKDPASKTGQKKGAKKPPWIQEEEHQRAFKDAKKMLAEAVFLLFPDFTKEFHLYSDASDVHLGVTLLKEGCPLRFYTQNLNSAQLNYTVEKKKELLGIFEGVKAFKGMIRGFNLTIHTELLNFLYKKLLNKQMVRWRLLLEEFHLTM